MVVMMLLRLVMLRRDERRLLMLVPLLRARWLREQIQVLRRVETMDEVRTTHTHVEEMELSTGAKIVLRLLPQG